MQSLFILWMAVVSLSSVQCGSLFDFDQHQPFVSGTRDISDHILLEDEPTPTSRVVENFTLSKMETKDETSTPASGVKNKNGYEILNPNSYTNQMHNKYPGLAKYLPSVFTLVKFFNYDCKSGGLTGTCMTQPECYARGGMGQENCAEGFGVCCMFFRTCGQNAYQNNTHFVNPNFPGSFNLNDTMQTIRCDLQVHKMRFDVCQLRLDFEEFQLAGSSDCQLDRFTVPSSGAPVVCGKNKGQHMYVDFPYGVDLLTLPMTITSTAADRQFAIRISQVLCGSLRQAPSGCLQFFTERAGVLQSFNYGDPINNPQDGNSGYSPNANYGMCIRKGKEFCGIRYTRGGPFDVGTVITDGSDGAQTGSNCQNLPLALPGRGDYLIMPNTGTSSSSGALTNDRYCGDNFVTSETRTMPFVVYFVSDSNNNGEGGFRINYEQMQC